MYHSHSQVLTLSAVTLSQVSPCTSSWPGTPGSVQAGPEWPLISQLKLPSVKITDMCYQGQDNSSFSVMAKHVFMAVFPVL